MLVRDIQYTLYSRFRILSVLTNENGIKGHESDKWVSLLCTETLITA